MKQTIPIQPSNSSFNTEQWQAIHQQGGNILISASAGSGKTTVLIERILNHLLNHSTAINELLVVTFTESAAKEMKQRLESRLKQAVNQHSNLGQQHLIEQLRLLPESDIRTLHSFYIKVIKQFYYLKNLNPSLKLTTDEAELMTIKLSVWEELIAEIIEQGTPISQETYLNLLSIFGNGRSDQGLIDQVLGIYNFSMAHPYPNRWLNQATDLYDHPEQIFDTELFKAVVVPHITAIIATCQSYYEQCLAFLSGAQEATQERYYDLLKTEHDTIVTASQYWTQEAYREFIESLNSFQFDRWPASVKKTAEDKDLIQMMKNLRDQAKDLCVKKLFSLFKYSYDEQIAIEDKIKYILDPLVKLVQAFSKSYQLRKNQLEIMEYNDIEHMTLDLLTFEDPLTKQLTASEAAIYFQNQFKEILVDEYQDINDIQAEILSWLSHERTERAGNLFMVGDVKQSIYGFRMAEPQLFLDKYYQYQSSKNDTLIILNKNYRSRYAILEFTNFVFERIMDEQVGQMPYGEAEKLVTGNLSFIDPYDLHYVELLLYEEDSLENTPSPMIKSEAEYHMIAQDIKKRIAKEELVYCKKIDAMRPIEFKDITLLSSTKTNYHILQKVFDRYDLPLKAQKIDSFFQRQEIQLMVSLLSLIDNPIQDIHLVAVLRSYFVGLTDDDLAIIRINHPSGNFYQAIQHFVRSTSEQNNSERAISTKIEFFLSRLNQWTMDASNLSLVDLIWKIYLQTDYLDYVSGLQNGNQRKANLHALYMHAGEFEQANSTSLHRFILYIEQLMEHDKDLAEPVLVNDDENAIQAMTVHASKGLEFPVVYLINTHRQMNLQDLRQKIIHSKHDGVAMNYESEAHPFIYQSLIKEALLISKNKQLKAEEMRKLYVALTRSEQRLIITGTIKNEEDWSEKIDQYQLINASETLTVNSLAREECNQWLGWIQMSLSKSIATNGFDINQIPIHFINDQKLIEQLPEGQIKTEGNHHQLVNPDQQPLNPNDDLIKLITFSYPQRLATLTSSYQSVSELKRLYEEPRIEKLSYFMDRTKKNQLNAETFQDQISSIRYTEDTFADPKFINDMHISSTERGTATHYFLQQLAFRSIDPINIYESLQEQLSQMIYEGSLTSQQVELIDLNQIEWFLNTDLGQLILSQPDSLEREVAFSYRLPAKDMFKNQLQEMKLSELDDNQLLVHGVIDAYFNDGQQMILFDYKTDRFRIGVNATRAEQIKIITDNYRFQLSIYSRALSLAKNTSVSKVYLVLLDFQEIILLDELFDF